MSCPSKIQVAPTQNRRTEFSGALEQYVRVSACRDGLQAGLTRVNRLLLSMEGLQASLAVAEREAR
jgi:hypothetical protein